MYWICQPLPPTTPTVLHQKKKSFFKWNFQLFLLIYNLTFPFIFSHKHKFNTNQNPSLKCLFLFFLNSDSPKFTLTPLFAVLSPPETAMATQNKPSKFRSITSCSGTEYESIAADLDGTLLISSSSFPYFMLVAIEAGSLLRGLILLLSLPIVIIAYLFVSEAIGIQILIFISYAGLKVRDIELVSRAVLPR